MREITRTISVSVNGKPMDFRLTKLDAFSRVTLLRLMAKMPEGGSGDGRGRSCISKQLSRKRRKPVEPVTDQIAPPQIPPYTAPPTAPATAPGTAPIPHPNTAPKTPPATAPPTAPMAAALWALLFIYCRSFIASCTCIYVPAGKGGI